MMANRRAKKEKSTLYQPQNVGQGLEDDETTLLLHNS